jgi:O-antigen/teichoic acid export membrane protein
MSKKQSLRNPALYLVHHGARYLFPLAVTPFLAHKFGPSYFADFVIWNSCVWTASLFMEYGFFLYAVNETALSGTKDQLQMTLSKIVSAKLCLLPIAITVYAILTVATGLVDRQPVAALIGAIAVVSYGGSFAWYFQGQERAATAVLVEAVPQCLQFVLVFLTIRGPTDVWIAALLQCAAAAGTIVIASIMVARDRLAWDLSLKGVGQAIKGGTPFFVERLCLTLYQTATPLFIAAFAVKEQAAYYSVGDKFLQFLGGLSIPLTYALLPNISRRVAAENANWGLSIRVVTIVSVSTCLLALASFLGAKWIILLLFRAEYAAAIPVARCFCFAACLVSYNACIANFILVPGGRSRVLIATSISALVLSLGSQVVLLPRYGALGSAVSRAIAEIGVAIILTLVATRLIAGREPKLGIQK